MICKKCGAQLEDNSKFCGFCGTTIEEVPATDIFNMGAPVQPAEPAQPAAPAPMPEVNIEPIAPMPEAQPVNIEPIAPMPEVQPVNVEPIASMPEVQPVNVEPVQPTPQVVEPVQPIEPINMNNGVVPPIDGLSTQQTSNDIEPEEKKKSALPIILIILILLGVGGFFAYKYFFNKPDKVVKSLINKAYDKFETPMKKLSNDNAVITDVELSMNTNIPGLEDLNGMKFNIRAGVDNTNDKYEFGLAYLEDNEKIMDIIMYILDGNAYMMLKDVYPNLLNMDIADADLEEFKQATTAVSPKDTEFVMKRMKEIFLESLDMNDFKQSSDKITLNGSETKVKKISYILDSEKMAKLTNNMIDNILKDKELLNKLSEMTEMDIETLKEELESSKIDMSDVETSEDSETVKFDIYTKGITDEFAGMDIEAPDNTTIQVRNNNDNTTVNANLSGISLQLVKKEVSSEKTTIDVKINVLTEEITGLITLEEKSLDSNITESKITMNFNYQEYEVGLTLNSKQQIGANIADIDVTTAKTIDELTPEEEEVIEQKFEEKLMNSKLYNLINSAMENMLGEMEQKMMYYDESEYYNSAL